MARRTKNPAAPPAAHALPPLALPAELTIYAVGELHPQWRAWLGQTDSAPAAEPAVVDAAAVDQVDGAGLQLLLSLQRSLTERGRGLQLRRASAVLQQACAALGLGDWLQAHSGTDGAAA